MSALTISASHARSVEFMTEGDRPKMDLIRTSTAVLYPKLSTWAIALDTDEVSTKKYSKDYFTLGLLALGIHVALLALSNSFGDSTATLDQKPSRPILIELAQVPEIKLPQPLITPQKIEPLRPRLDIPVASKPAVLPAETISEPTTASNSLAPSAAESTTQAASAVPVSMPTVPAPPVQETITEARGSAGYLNNPPPSYPAVAQRQGWEGKVVLKVRVQANGKPDSVQIQQSSGRQALDEAALNAVKQWTFIPAKRGTTPIDGWAIVPIEFKLGR